MEIICFRKDVLGFACCALLVPVGFALGQDPIDHLLQAAEHLDKAGMPEMAAEVRQAAAERLAGETQKQLEQKLAQREELEAEIAQLRKLLGEDQQIILKVKVYDINAGQSQDGFGLVSLHSMLGENGPTCVVDDDGTLTQFLDFLQQQKMVRVLASPSLVVISGRKASLVSGGEARLATGAGEDSSQGSFQGIRLDCTPKLRKDGKVALNLDLQISPGRTDDNLAKTESAMARLNTQLEIPLGKTVLASCPSGKQHASGVFVLISAELIEPKGKSSP